MGFSVEVATTVADAERLASLWAAVPWEREEAELEYLLARVEERAEAAAPFGIVVHRAGEPAAALAGRLETRRLDTTFGHRVVYAPRLRLLQAVDGGVVAPDPAAVSPLVEALRAALAGGVADAAAISPLPLGSELFSVLESAGGVLGRQRFLAAWERRLLVLPSSFDEYLASRSGKVRFGIRYDAKKLLEALGDELSVRVLAGADDHDRLIRDLERVARSTYQRRAGAGFADTPEQRRLVRIGLERGWLRAYVLYRGETPIAFWHCSVYRGTILLKTTGFDPEYRRLRVGVYLLMRVIEDACGDPALRVLDFGPGDADYKRYFSGESHLERNLLLFAPTLRARRVNALRTGVLAGARAARRFADAAGVTGRLRARRRERLRRRSS